MVGQNEAHSPTNNMVVVHHMFIEFLMPYALGRGNVVNAVADGQLHGIISSYVRGRVSVDPVAVSCFGRPCRVSSAPHLIVSYRFIKTSLSLTECLNRY